MREYLPRGGLRRARWVLVAASATLWACGDDGSTTDAAAAAKKSKHDLPGDPGRS